MSRVVFKFKNVSDYLHAIKAKTDYTGYRASREKGNEEFRGCGSFEEAIKLATKGWKDGAEQAKVMSRKVNEKLELVTTHKIKQFRKQVFGGGTLLVSNYLRGDPDCYLHLRKEKAKKFIRVTANIGALANVDKSLMIIRGVTMAAVIDALELRNYRVKVDLVQACTGYGFDGIETYVTLKDFSESLELDRLVFFLAHPASLRRLHFSLRETLPDWMRQGLGVGGSYGRSTDVDMENRGELHIGAANGRYPWDNEQNAIAFVIAELKKQGIELT